MSIFMAFVAGFMVRNSITLLIEGKTGFAIGSFLGAALILSTAALMRTGAKGARL